MCMKTKILKKTDIVLIAGFLAFAAAFYFIFDMIPQNGGTVVIRCDGKVYEEVPIGKTQNVEIYSADGRLTNIVAVQNKEAFMAYADCPDGLCVKHSPIGPNGGGTIICLPNRVSVEVKSKGNPGFDTVIGRR